MPDPATGGTLRDTIARAHFTYDPCYVSPWDEQPDDIREWYLECADAEIVALKEHLAEHPAAIEELGWDDVARRDGWLIDIGSGHMRENFVPVETVYGARVYAPPPNGGTAPAPPTPSIPGEDA